MYVRPFCSYVVRFELHFGVIFIAILGTAHASQPSQSQRSGVTFLHGFFSNEVTHSFPFTMTVGYPKRGRRAGVKTRAEEARKQFNIRVISSPCFQYANLQLTRGVNFNNLIAVSKTKPSHQNRASVHFVPRVMLANTMSLVPKLDEVQELLLRLNVQVGCIVESYGSVIISSGKIDPLTNMAAYVYTVKIISSFKSLKINNAAAIKK